MKKNILNPFLPLDKYIPDGEPHVFGNRVYLFGSHDIEGGEMYCQAGNYLGFSAPIDDLSDWRNEGVIYDVRQHPNGTGHQLHAPDVVCGNDGKYYLYYSLDKFDMGIHVAVCDTPAGKYKYYGQVRNADNTPLKRFVPYDPAVINDNGTIRLYYGWSLSMVAAQANRGVVTKEVPQNIKSLIVHGEMRMFNRTKDEVESEDGGSVMGAVTCTLADDMLTVVEQPKRIVPGQFMSEGTGYENHAFYEASSIRKIDDTYYFIYSSMQSNELCYATSKFPDKDFKYRGVIISNGDIGYKGRKPEDRLNMTANNHGSIEKINDKWYIFYHRQTHNSTYSRQACAEQIEILSDGSIPQVEMTSCGLNGGPLIPQGEFSAAVCCNLSNGKMPHITNRILNADIPYITHSGDERFITNIKIGSWASYKYFDFDGDYIFTLFARGAAGDFEISFGDEETYQIHIDGSDIWKPYKIEINAKGVKPIIIKYVGNSSADILKFTLNKLHRKE